MSSISARFCPCYPRGITPNRENSWKFTAELGTKECTPYATIVAVWKENRRKQANIIPQMTIS
jgi:hypothetical protein